MRSHLDCRCPTALDSRSWCLDGEQEVQEQALRLLWADGSPDRTRGRTSARVRAQGHTGDRVAQGAVVSSLQRGKGRPGALSHGGAAICGSPPGRASEPRAEWSAEAQEEPPASGCPFAM